MKNKETIKLLFIDMSKYNALPELPDNLPIIMIHENDASPAYIVDTGISADLLEKNEK